MFTSRRARSVLLCLITSLALFGIPQWSVTAIAQEASVFRLTLPPRIIAVPGVEMNLYFANTTLVPAGQGMVYEVDCKLGSSDAKRWTLTATQENVGEVPMIVRAKDPSGAIVQTASTVVTVVPQTAGADRQIRLLIIGDSLTHATVYPNEIARLLNEPGNPQWQMLGTHKPGGAAEKVVHEGYGGWTWAAFNSRFAVDAAKPGSSSPFVFPGSDGKPVLDMPRYFDERCGGERPDFVVIKLGINDCFGFNPNDSKQLDSQIDGMFQQAETLLTELRRTVPAAEIGICLTTPGNARDEAFVANYQDRYPRWGWRQIQHRLVERQLTHFAMREAEHITLIPTELNLDTVDGYPDNNAVHPNTHGYQQIGKTVYSWLKWRLSLAN